MAAAAAAAPPAGSLQRKIKSHNELTHTLTVGAGMVLVVVALVVSGVGGQSRVLPKAGGLEEGTPLLKKK